MPADCIIQTQARLDELTSRGFIRQPVGTLRALLANPNLNIQQKMLENDGEVKKYQITYIKPDCGELPDCDSEAAKRCASGTFKPVESDYKTIDGCLSSGVIELTDAQYRDLCNFGPREFTLQQILGKLDKMSRAANAQVLATICANAGCITPGTPPVNTRKIQLIDPVTGAPTWTADVDILADFADAGLTEVPMLIGGRSLLKYDKGVRNGAANGGVNIGSMENFPSYYDNQLATVCPDGDGNEPLLAIAPGVVSYVNYMENVGDFQSNLDFNTIDPLAFMRAGEMYNYGVIQDPYTGLMYDMDVIFDPCDKKWKLSFRTHFDTWVMPLQQCFGACFTGIVKYGICPAPALTC